MNKTHKALLVSTVLSGSLLWQQAPVAAAPDGTEARMLLAQQGPNENDPRRRREQQQRAPQPQQRPPVRTQQPNQPQRPTVQQPSPPQRPAVQGQPPRPQGAPQRPAQGQPPATRSMQGQQQPGQQPAQRPAGRPAGQPQRPAQGQPPGQPSGQPQRPAQGRAVGQPQRPAQGQPAGRPGAPTVQGQPAGRPQQPAQGRPRGPATAGRPAPLPTPPTAQGQPPRPVPLTAGAGGPRPVGTGGRPIRSVEELRRERRETREGGRTVIREADRVIVREGGRAFIRHNEVDRFRYNARNVTVQRRGADTMTVVERPGGVRIITVTDRDGRLLRRVRRMPDGREVVIIENRPRRIGPGGVVVGVAVGAVGLAALGYFVDLPPPVVRIPRERYILETEQAQPDDVYAVLTAPPVEPIERAYSLEEVRYSPALRDRMPRVDLDTINFSTGSWEITPDQANRLAVIAEGIKRAIARNPAEVFLIEGHTDAVGNEDDNLSLSDRRAEAVALVLTETFEVPPENLVSQGYGEQYLKVQTEGPLRENRRVTLRRITPLLTGEAQNAGQAN